MARVRLPAGSGHAFCALVPECLVSYKATNYYSYLNDARVRWDDPAIGIEWPSIADPETLSAEDKMQPLPAELPAHFTFEG